MDLSSSLRRPCNATSLPNSSTKNYTASLPSEPAGTHFSAACTNPQFAFRMTALFRRMNMRAFSRVVLVSLVCLLATVLMAQSHARTKKSAAKQSHAAAASAKPSTAEAQKFIDDSEKQLSDLADKGQRADWVNENFITD